MPAMCCPVSLCGARVARLVHANTAGAHQGRSSDTHLAPSRARGSGHSLGWSAAAAPPCSWRCRIRPPSQSFPRWASGMTNTMACLQSPELANILSRLPTPWVHKKHTEHKHTGTLYRLAVPTYRQSGWLTRVAVFNAISLSSLFPVSTVLRHHIFIYLFKSKIKNMSTDE